MLLFEDAQSLLKTADFIRKVRAKRTSVTNCNDFNIYDSVIDVRDVAPTAKWRA